MRYEPYGELHMDFHGSTCVAVRYILEHYGEEALREILHATGTRVYKTMHEKIQAGDLTELVEFWSCFQTREGADYTIDSTPDRLEMTVRDCPALHRITDQNDPEPQLLCRATKLLNEALVSDSPFVAETESTGKFSCRQCIRRKR